MLTKKQHELLVFIAQRLNRDGISPSYDEMKEALGLASKSGIHRLITGLEERGFIRRLPHRARALEILRLPEDMANGGKEDMANGGKEDMANGGKPATAGGFDAKIIHGEFKMTGCEPPANAEAMDIPLYGRIAAGTPIEAMRDQSSSIAIPPSLLGRGEHYALEVDGDSMIDAGIHDGDTVLIRHAEKAENGAIVVAIVDNQEVTLKRLRRKGQSIALEPANKAYETRIFGPDRVKVQGLLVGLIRRY